MKTFLDTNRAFEQTNNKIVSFRNLPNNWHYGEGISPSRETIDIALKFNYVARIVQFSKTDAFPGIDGEIQFCAYKDSLYVEFTIEPNDKITFVYEVGSTEIEYCENLSFEEAISKLYGFGSKLWALSGSSIATTLILQREDSKVLLSNHPVMGVASQFLIKNARYTPANAYAATSQDIIRMTQNPQQSSGKYHPNYSLSSAS